MINYRYAYLLLVCDDEGICLKYDYLACNEKFFNNTAVYDYLSGIDLCCYDLHDKMDNADFFDRVSELMDEPTIEHIHVLFDLANELPEFLEV